MKNMKTELLKKGSLVKNIRSNEIGVIVNEDDLNIENDSQYYKVLTDGEIVSWFKPNIEIYNERPQRAFRERLAR